MVSGGRGVGGGPNAKPALDPMLSLLWIHCQACFGSNAKPALDPLLSLQARAPESISGVLKVCNSLKWLTLFSQILSTLIKNIPQGPAFVNIFFLCNGTKFD